MWIAECIDSCRLSKRVLSVSIMKTRGMGPENEGVVVVLEKSMIWLGALIYVMDSDLVVSSTSNASSSLNG